MYFSATAPSEKGHRSRRALQRRLPDLFLDIGNHLTRYWHHTSGGSGPRSRGPLDDEIARKVLRFDLAPFFEGFRCRNSHNSAHRKWAIQAAFERAGILFITDDEIVGIGVRLAKKKRR